MKKYLFFLLIFTVLLLLTGCEDNSKEVDKTTPEVVITNPVNNAEIDSGQIVTIIAEATDNKGIEKVEFKINGELVYEDEEEPYQYEWDTAGLSGDYSLLAKTFDTSGNTGLSEVINVNIISGGDNNPPDEPYDPTPSDNSENVSISADLSWYGSDPDGDDLTYDVYWGTDLTPDAGELVSENQAGTSYNPGTMNYEITYYWKIVASDGEYEIEGDVWSFTTIENEVPEGMIFVEGGTFNNGTSDVTVSSFHIGQYELTQSEYEAVMGNNPSHFTGVTNGPVECVTWFDAIEYCNRRSMDEGITPCYSYSTYGTNPDNWPVGWNTSDGNHTNVSCDWTANCYRLPTEAEWHFAALGGNETHNYTYSGSSNIDEVAWYWDNSGGTTHAVGTKVANELGTYDMSGNVWEWVWDIYGTYPGGAQTNPHGAVSGNVRVRRGGGWSDYADVCTVSYRSVCYATSSSDYIGFRLCRVSP